MARRSSTIPGGGLGFHPQAGPFDDPSRYVPRDAELDIEIVLREGSEPYAKQSSPLSALGTDLADCGLSGMRLKIECTVADPQRDHRLPTLVFR